MASRCWQTLVVTTNPLRRSFLEFSLAKAGSVVTVAPDAKAAFQVAAKRHFDLVITDERTPQGAGADLARQLRYLDQYASVPLVLLAEEKTELDLEYLRDGLWVLVIREPYDIAEVVKKITRQFVTHQTPC
jgi:DNA-binding response OmpR family regulator